MADISAELAAIESAVYGEEVRDAIHDGLEKMNSDLNTAIGHQLLTVDDTLTLTGQGADAKVVGDRAQLVFLSPTAHGYHSCNEIKVNRTYFLSSIDQQVVLEDYAWNAAGWLTTIKANDSIVFQLAFPYGNDKSVKMRVCRNGTWGEWQDTNHAANEACYEMLENLKDANSFGIDITPTDRTYSGVTYTWHDNVCTVAGFTTSATNANNIFSSSNSFPEGLGPGKILGIDAKATNVKTEIFVYINGTIKSIFNTTSGGICVIPTSATGLIIRLRALPNVNINEEVTVKLSVVNSAATLFATLANYGDVANASYSDCNDVDVNGLYFVVSTDGVPALSNFAWNDSGWLQTIITSTFKFQVAYPYKTSSGNKPMFRRYDGVSWSDWALFGGQSSTTIIEKGTYNNTYNINTSPTITTDTNGWLQAVDVDSEDETSKTDMTGAIMSMLNSTGYCHLGPGIFYVSGGIDMPNYSMIEGCGRNTEIRLLSSVTNGYCLKVKNSNTVKNLTLSGAYGTIDTQTSGDIGGRDAIHVTGNNGFPCVVSNCYIRDFSGSAIYQNNTGGSVLGYIHVTDCLIWRCKVGINIDYASEYCKYTSVMINRAYYACINNGGNNVFVGCTFHGVIGFLLDNSNSDKSNNAHGSAIGCTFNHIDNINRPSTAGMGLAVKMINASNGFIFDGCQFWYGEIYLDNSRGISFSNCLIGGNTPSIEVYGTYPAFFSDCIFHQSPTLTVNSSTKFNGCYLDSDGSLVTP